MIGKGPLAICFWIILAACAPAREGEVAMPSVEVELVQATVLSEALVEYFHFDERPPPLRVFDATGRADLGLVEAGGVPVEVVSRAEREALVVDDIAIGGRNASVRFSYDIEGLDGEAQFRRSADRWELVDIQIFEH